MLRVSHMVDRTFSTRSSGIPLYVKDSPALLLLLISQEGELIYLRIIAEKEEVDDARLLLLLFASDGDWDSITHLIQLPTHQTIFHPPTSCADIFVVMH